MAEVLNLLKKSRFDKIPSLLSEIARGLYPVDPTSALFHILEKILILKGIDPFESQYLPGMIARALPADLAELLFAKRASLMLDHSAADLGQYLSLLEKEFPDPAERDIAHSILLVNTLEKQLDRRAPPLRDIHQARHKRELGITSNDPGSPLTEMAMKAIRLDPGNRRAYECLAKLPRWSRPMKKRVEEGLTKMLEQFPGDPYPCLELATLYYEKNAFRKAENILKEARKRAPHDARVQDRSVLALLISTDKGLQRKKFHLASRDIEKARRMASGAILPLVIEKHIVFQIEQRGQLSLFDEKVVKSARAVSGIVQKATQPLDLFNRLRTLGMLILDMKSRRGSKDAPVLKELDKIFHRLRRRFKELSPGEVCRLLAPMGEEEARVTHARDMAGVFLKRDAKILTRVDDADMVAVLDILVESQLYQPALKEIRRRKKAPPELRLLFDFYGVVIQHLAGRISDDADAFEEVLDEADDTQKETLRIASRRLAPHASGRLKNALERFDFDLLETRPFPNLLSMLNPFDDDDDDDDDDDEYDAYDDDDDFFPSMNLFDDEGSFFPPMGLFDDDEDDDGEWVLFKGNTPGEAIRHMEKVVDALGFRGAPNHAITQMRTITMMMPPLKEELDRVARFIDVESRMKLSREARVFLFGKH
ncbi:MAG: tetratricopeptide repeat protein [Desulfobacterales bacterium]|nr:tetratricopeptide repeat protein [Desulfobacterales bacterium]